MPLQVGRWPPRPVLQHPALLNRQPHMFITHFKCREDGAQRPPSYWDNSWINSWKFVFKKTREA